MTRVLIIRLSAIGDIVMASPLVGALRRTWPDAHLAWLCEPQGLDLLRHNPDLDEVIPWPKARWKELWRSRDLRTLYREVRTFARQLRERRFDLVLDTQGLMKSGLLAWLTGAPRRVGLGSQEASQWLMTEVLDRRGDDIRIGSEYRKLARYLELAPSAGAEPFPLHLAVSPRDRKTVRILLDSIGVSTHYAVLCPFTTRPQKHWFEDRWAELARRCPGELGLMPVLLGGPDDQEAALRIQQGAGSDLRNLTGRTGLGESLAVIEAASLLVGVDTGLTHMGIAFGHPTVALFGSTRPYLETGQAPARVLYNPLPCSPCRRKPTCGGRFDCMRSHHVNTVLTAAAQLLASTPVGNPNDRAAEARKAPGGLGP